MEKHTNLASIIEKVLKIKQDPVLFYREMPKTGGYLEPVLFVTVMAAVVGLLITLFSLFDLGIMGGTAFGFGAIMFTILISIISCFIGAAILFVIWKLMGSNQSYEVAYRCIAYASVVYLIAAVLGPIPYIGSIISVLIGTYLLIIASTEVHGIKQKTAYLVFGVLGLFGLISNISNEMAIRSMTSQAEEFAEQFKDFSDKTGNPKDMTPEEAGRALGEFFKGFESGSK
jgi:hypothetical protein